MHCDRSGQEVTQGTIEQQDFKAQEPNLVVGFYLVCGVCLQALVASASLGYDPPGLVSDGRVVGSARGVGLPSQPRVDERGKHAAYLARRGLGKQIR